MNFLVFKIHQILTIPTGKITSTPLEAFHDASAQRPLPQEPSALLVRFQPLPYP
jgi:hypothetical protein